MKTQQLLNYERDYQGTNYPSLLNAKRRYDPLNLLNGHHDVGS